jgi:site-specific DNA recombinase
MKIPGQLSVQINILADNRIDQKLGNTVEVPSLLAGLLKDAAGEPLTASHASKGNRRYRYYVSRSLLTASRQDAPDSLRLPAADIEAVVETRMITLLTTPGEFHQLIGAHVPDAAQLEHLNRKAETLGRTWRTLATSHRRALLLSALVEVVVQRNCVDLKITPHGLTQSLLSWPNPAKADVQGDKSSQHAITITLSVSAALKRSGIGKRMIIAGTTTSEPDPALMKLLIKAREMRDAVLAGNGVTVASIAAARGINDSYATRLLRLSFLSPDLVKMILDGRQPATLTARRLCADTRLPIAWSDQLAALA